jgi:pimeloyl-ACP methyl ester carboxylesterase
MIERAHRFGKEGYLVGIVTEPGFEVRKEGMPSILFLTAGRVHRVGPHRLYVDVARKLACLGFISFRFDLGGVGDSESSKGNGSLEDRAVSEIQEAMNFLSTHKGVNEFVLMGLCSGADDAYRAAIVDPRVVGAVLLDGFGYRTWGFYPRNCLYYLQHHGRQVLNLNKWRRFIRQKWSSIFTEKHESGVGDDPNFRVFPPKETVTKDLGILVERGVSMLFIYSGGIPSYYIYRDQFKDMFRSIDLRGQVQYEYFNEANHIFSLLEDRNRLMITICDWTQTHYQPRREQRIVHLEKAYGTG